MEEELLGKKFIECAVIVDIYLLIFRMKPLLTLRSHVSATLYSLIHTLFIDLIFRQKLNSLTNNKKTAL